MVNPELKRYVEDEIIPGYASFDKAHREDHARTVISRSFDIARAVEYRTGALDDDVIYAAAAFHDTGLVDGREVHHLSSGRIIRADGRLREWFDAQTVEIIAQAAEDHRASSDHMPRSIYGCILAEADRLIDPLVIIRRTVQYGLSHYPQLDREGHWQRTLEHLHEKYADGGYLKLMVPESDNAARLEELRVIIREHDAAGPEAGETRLRDLFDRAYQRQAVLDFLNAKGIDYEIHEHPPIFTVEEALAYWKDIDRCVHCKNLFMRNHKGNRHYLISFECHKTFDIHALEHALHQGKLSFASPERMMRCLGLKPGSVSAFGLINDIEPVGTVTGDGKAADPKELFENGHRVKFYADRQLLEAERISFHPCDNMASVVVSRDSFLRFLELWGGEVEWLDI